MSLLAPIAEADEPLYTRTLPASARKPVPYSSPPLSLPSTPDDLSPRSSPTPAAGPSATTTSAAAARSRSADRAAFNEARALYDSGVALSRDGNPLAATRHFRQAAVVFGDMDGQEKRRDKSMWQAGMCYASLGMRAKKRGEKETARGALEQARSCFHFINERAKEAMAMFQLALLALPDLSQATEQLKAAAVMYADLGDEAREAMCYAELGHLFSASDPDTAVFFLKQCLLLYLKLGDSHREGKVLYTIGLLASSAALDDRRTGYNYLAQARVIFRRRGDTADEGDACYALGKSCVRSGAFEQAVKYFEEASSLFHSAHLPVDEAWASYRLALVMLKVRSASLAISYLSDARQLFAEAPSDERHAEGSCCLRIAEILSGAVGGKAGGEQVRDEVRAADFFDEAARLLALDDSTISTPTPSSRSTPQSSRTRSRSRKHGAPAASAAASSPDSPAGSSSLLRRRSTMSVARAEERRRRLVQDGAGSGSGAASPARMGSSALGSLSGDGGESLVASAGHGLGHGLDEEEGEEVRENR
ncbi:hypothetical protein JCM3775_002764 [Rhodotorula graminis]